MTKPLRHRRLYAFYHSKVLNALFTVIIVSLLQIGYMRPMLIPGICAAVATALFLGYALWLWIKKPPQVVINKWLSDANGWFTLYFLIVSARRASAVWWYAIPTVGAILLLFIAMLRPQDEMFDIDKP